MDAPPEKIGEARDDARNALLIAHYLYEAERWIYGDGAFGLRFMAWSARKAPDALIDNIMILMFRLRQVPDAILSSDEIAEMAKQARRSASLRSSANGCGAMIRASRKSSIQSE
jgi:hypothetical protein